MSPPSWFSCHPWSISHASLVLGLRHLLDRHGETDATSVWVAAYCLYQHDEVSHAPDVVLPAVFGSRHLCDIAVHIDSQREIWRRMWCLSEILASATHGGEAMHVSFVAVEESKSGETTACSLSDHPVAVTESESERRSRDARFPLSAFALNRPIAIDTSCATLQEDEEAILRQIIKESGEGNSGSHASRSPSSPKQHPAYLKANTLLRVKIEAAAMRVAVLAQDEKMQGALLRGAQNNETLRGELKQAIELLDVTIVGKALY